jgi:hypothetical protein
MVRHVFLLLFILWPIAIPAQEPRKAEAVMPKPSDFPGGYKYPWELGGKERKYANEADYRAKHPNTLEAMGQAAQQIQQIPDDQWAEMRDQTKKMAQKLGSMDALAQNPAQRALLEAILNNGTKEAAIKALQSAYKDVVDFAVMEYVKVEKPAALEAAESKDRDPGSTVRLTIEMNVRTAESVKSKPEEIDYDAARLDKLVSDSKNTFQRLVQLAVTEVCKNLEEDLIDEYSQTPRKEKTEELLNRMSEYSTTRIAVKGYRPALGSAAHVLYMSRDKLADQPKAVQGSAQLRRGVAVFRVEFQVAGKYADNFEEELARILEILASRAAPFDLDRQRP